MADYFVVYTHRGKPAQASANGADDARYICERLKRSGFHDAKIRQSRGPRREKVFAAPAAVAAPAYHNDARGYVYLVKSGEHYKIGRAKEYNSRLSSMQTGNPVPLEIVGVWEVSNAPTVEGDLHREYNSFRFRGEWFALSPASVNEIIETMTREHRRAR